MPATIREVLGDKDYFPPELVAQAKNLYEALLVYTGHAEKAVSGIVRDRMALKLDRKEAGDAIGKILDVQEDVEKRAAEAFAIISADFEPRKAEHPASPPPPPPAPTAPEPAAPQGNSAPAPTPATPAPVVDPVLEQIKNALSTSGGTTSTSPAPATSVVTSASAPAATTEKPLPGV